MPESAACLSDKETAEKGEEEFDSLPDFVFPLFLTTKTQEIFCCKVDEDITTESPFKLIHKDDILQDYKDRAAISDFHPAKKIVQVTLFHLLYASCLYLWSFTVLNNSVFKSPNMSLLISGTFHMKTCWSFLLFLPTIQNCFYFLFTTKELPCKWVALGLWPSFPIWAKFLPGHFWRREGLCSECEFCSTTHRILSSLLPVMFGIYLPNILSDFIYRDILQCSSFCLATYCGGRGGKWVCWLIYSTQCAISKTMGFPW